MSNEFYRNIASIRFHYFKMQEQRAPASQCFTKPLRLWLPSGIQDEEASPYNTCYSMPEGKAELQN